MLRIGSTTQTRTFVAGISGPVVTGAIVQVNAAGQLGTAPSSARFKEKIRRMDQDSEVLYALEPVTFRYKREIDPAETPQLRLVAEDVEKVNPDLVVRDKEGKAYSVRYDQVNAMLLNEFLKEHRKVEAQQSKIEEQEARIAQHERQIEALASGLQKVSAQIGMSKAASQVLVDDP